MDKQKRLNYWDGQGTDQADGVMVENIIELLKGSTSGLKCQKNSERRETNRICETEILNFYQSCGYTYISGIWQASGRMHHIGYHKIETIAFMIGIILKSLCLKQ